MTGYVSLEMARRLQEEGVKMETEKYWVLRDNGWELKSLNERGWKPVIYDRLRTGKAFSAPSLAELWEWLPEENGGYWLVLEKDIASTVIVSVAGYKCVGEEPWMVSEQDTNPADALGELAIWLAGKEGCGA